MYIKHVEECLTLGKCYITITRQKWCNQSTIILRIYNVSCIFRWCDGLFPANPSTLPTQHCVGARMCIHGLVDEEGFSHDRGKDNWSGPKWYSGPWPPRNPLELTRPGNWTSVVVSEEFPSVACKHRFWKMGPTHWRLHGKKTTPCTAANKDELQFRWFY